MGGERIQAAQADIGWRVDTHDVRQDVSAVRRDFVEATRGMSTAALDLAVKLEKRDRALAKYGANSTQAKSAEIALRRATDDATRASDKHSRSLDDESRSLNKLIRGSIAGSGVLQQLGRQIAFASGSFIGGAGLTYALTSTLKIAGEFEQQMHILGAVSGASAEQLERASQASKELGADLSLPATSAKDAAIAMTELAKAGLTVQDAIAGARGTLELAAAASISASDAAKITGSALNAFSLEGSKATMVADQLAAAANAAQGEIPDMALALKQASTVAASFGLSTGETITALAQLAKAGVIGSDAGTSLRVMLTYLIPKSDAAAESINRYGLSVRSAAGGFLSIRDVIAKYQQSLARLEPFERQRVIRTIFGQDAQRAANILLLRGVDAYNKLGVAVEKQGAASDLAAARNKGYLGALDGFKSAVETLQISIGTKLLPTFTENLRSLAEYVNRTEESGRAAERLGDTVQQIAGSFAAARDAIKPVVDALGGFQNTVGLLFGLYLTRKVMQFAASFGIIATSSAATRAKVVADATAMGAALDVATRPRAVTVTTVGGGVAGGGRGGGAGRVVGGLLGGPLTTAATLIGTSYLYNAGKRNAEKAKWDSLTPQQQRASLRNSGIPQEQWDSFLQQFGYDLKPLVVKPGKGAATHPEEGVGRGNRIGARRTPAPAPRTGGPGGAPTGDGLTRRQRLELNLEEAQVRYGDTPSRVLPHARALLDYFRTVESNTKATGDDLVKIRQQTLRAEATVTQLAGQIAADRERAATERAKDQEQADLRAEKLRRQRDPKLRSIEKAQRGAKGTKRLTDDERFAADEVRFWRGRLANLKKDTAAYDYVAGQLEKAEGDLQEVRARMARASETAAAKATDVELPRGLRIEELEAQLKEGEADDEAVDRKIEAYWRRRLARTKKGTDMYEEVLGQLVSAVKERRDAGEDQMSSAQMGQLFRDFLTGFADIQERFAANFGGGSGFGVGGLESLTRETNGHLVGINRAIRTGNGGWIRADQEAVMD